MRLVTKCVSILSMKPNIFSKAGEGGFSLVGSIVTAGMVGGLALLLANLSKQQQAVQKSTQTFFEVESLEKSMVRNLYNKGACKKTLNANSATVVDGKSIDYIKNNRGEDIFQVNSVYGNRLLVIESMSLINTQITGTKGTVDLKVVLEKKSKAIQGYKKVVKKLPIMFNVTAGTTNLLSCHHKVENLEQVVTDALNNQVEPLVDSKLNAVVQGLCGVFGGTYSASANRCTR